MIVELVSLPSQLQPHHRAGRCVVVFDVLRATTCMVAALHNGAKAVHVFEEIEPARSAAAGFDGPTLLAGEREGVLIEGFDLANSPLEMARRRVEGSTLFMTTTNGTRAIVAAKGAAVRVVAGFVNLSETARYVAATGLDVTLLSSGAAGAATGEDDLAAQALAAMLNGKPAPPRDDPERIALFRDTPGGRNVVRLGQHADLELAATVDCFDIVCTVDADDIVRRSHRWP